MIFSRKGVLIVASSKKEAIRKILASSEMVLYHFKKTNSYDKNFKTKKEAKFGSAQYLYCSTKNVDKKVYGEYCFKVTIAPNKIIDCSDFDIVKFKKELEKFNFPNYVIELYKGINRAFNCTVFQFLYVILKEHNDNIGNYIDAIKYKVNKTCENSEVAVFNTDCIKSVERFNEA